MLIKDSILDMSRQNQIAELTPWFNTQLETLILRECFVTKQHFLLIKTKLVQDLILYREEANINNVIIGISGGVDSAVTAALFKEAGWNVYGICLPIHQNHDELARSIYVCEALGIEYHIEDLTNAYEHLLATQTTLDPNIQDDDKCAKIRRGNIRARLRMITLYNMAAKRNGLVASTDNFTELAAGFWTLHGDVGDISPIQSLFKSWEVPMLAKMLHIPEAVWRATPTDGLGVDAGDEAQFGCSYLEYDIMLMTLLEHPEIISHNQEPLPSRAAQVMEIVTSRLKNTWFKRKNPVFLQNKLDPTRFRKLEMLDQLYQPTVIKHG